jgi:hypothetical protein
VADDEVEIAQCRQIDVADVAGVELEVVKTQRLHASAPLIYLHLRKVDAHDARLRIQRRKRDEVSTRGTADFEHMRTGNLGRVQPE